MTVYLLDRQFERWFQECPELDEQQRRSLMAAVKSELASDERLIILTIPQARRRLWKLLHEAYPGLTVLAFQELSPSLNIQPISRIQPDAVATS